MCHPSVMLTRVLWNKLSVLSGVFVISSVYSVLLLISRCVLVLSCNLSSEHQPHVSS